MDSNNHIHPLWMPAPGQCAKVMGILNVTPDSFSDGGKFDRLDNSLRQVEQMLLDGADIIDIGGESTRPGAAAVELDDELKRVIPVIEAIRKRFDCAISIDTCKAGVMAAAVEAGANIINDVNALRGENCVATAAKLQVPVCLMHMQGTPRTMQNNPVYEDVFEDIAVFFRERIAQCEAAGLPRGMICLDPGFGFGKTLAQNYQLLDRLEDFNALGLPVLAGMSRKSMIGNLLSVPVDERLSGSISCAVIAALKGAKIIRVHDVKATVDALKIVSATR